MDRLEAMTMLLAVTEKGTLSAASRSLQVPLATLSRKISDLETLLGTQLLIRTTRRVSLTDSGSAYVATVRQILEQLEEAEREVAGEFNAPKGELVVTAPVMFGRLHVLPIVVEFLATFPKINVRMILADRNVSLVDDHVDMAVRIGRLPDSSMVATSVGSLRTVTCASPRLLAATGLPSEPDDLLRFPCVTVDGSMPSPAWRFSGSAAGEWGDVAITPRLTVTTPEAAAEAAIQGVGVVRLLHYQVVDALERGDLQLILESFEPSPSPVHLVHASRSQMPLKMRRFLDLATPRLRQALDDVNGLSARRG